MLRRFLALLAVLVACLGFGLAAGVSPAAASTHQQRYNVAYFYAMDKANNYTGLSSFSLDWHAYHTAYSHFEFSYHTRYCGWKYYWIDINDDYTRRSVSSYGGSC